MKESELFNATSIYIPFKNACQDAHLTYAELADGSGVSLSIISKFMSGAVKRPYLDDLISMASCLNERAGRTVLSIDELTGLREPSDSDEHTRRIHELELEVERQKGEIERLETVNAIQLESLKIRQTLIFCLAAVCALLVVAVIGYVIFDMQLKHIGLFQSKGIAATAVLLIIIIIAAISVIAYSLISIFRKTH